MIQSFAVFDACRSYMHVGMARLVSRCSANLFIGEKGQRLDYVAPHLFECDPGGLIQHLVLSGNPPGELGIVAFSSCEFTQIFKHLRRFLTVFRQRDGKRVLFRYYDPRILRAFLPACTPKELTHFFGPIQKFACQGDDPGLVETFALGHECELLHNQWAFRDYFHTSYGVNPDDIQPLQLSMDAPKEHPAATAFREMRLKPWNGS